MNIKWGMVIPAAAVVAGAVVSTIALSADASQPTPALRQTTAVAPANSVYSGSIVDGQIGQSDLNSAFVKALYGVYDNTVKTPSIVKGAVTEDKLSPEAQAKLNSAVGKVSGVEADGPYPGSTLKPLQDYPGNGSQSTELVPGDNGAKTHTVWVKCAAGKVVTGYGYRVAPDATLAAKKAVQVTAVETTGEAIKGDAAGSILPTGVQVEVINNSADPVMVEPWATCILVG